MVHASIGKDVFFFGLDNGNGLGVVNGPSAFPVSMDVDVTMEGVAAASIRPSNGITINEPHPGRVGTENQHQGCHLPVDVAGKGKAKVDETQPSVCVSHGTFGGASLAGFLPPPSGPVAAGILLSEFKY